MGSDKIDWFAPAAATPRPAAMVPAAPASSTLPARPAAAFHLAADRAAPEFAGWSPPSMPAHLAQDPFERDTIEGRAQDLERNESLVSGAVASHKNSAIGTGFDLQPIPDYVTLGIDRATAQGKSRELEAIWREWSDEPDFCDLTGQHTFGLMTRQSGTHDQVQGESLGILRWEPERQQRRGSRFATVLQAIEPERLQSPFGRWDDPTLHDGVELDGETGEVVAYHFTEAHPNDWTALGRNMRTARVAARFPEGGRQVIHCYEPKWAGQTRGVSWLAPVMPELKMANRYKRAELQAAVVNAVIAATLETPLDGQALNDLFDDGKQYITQRDQAAPIPLGLGPGGAIPRLFPGEKLSSFTSARPNAQFDAFMTSIARHAAAGLNQPYEVFMRDFSRTNYSSARAALLEGWRSILVYRLLKGARWCKPVYAAVIDEAVWRGYIDLPRYMDGRRFRNAWLRSLWLGPPRGWVDPVKEIEAAMLRIQLGISTLRDEAQEQGRDWLELLDQIDLERQELKRRGITLPQIAPRLGGKEPPEEAPATAA